MVTRFQDRAQAGELLAERLGDYAGNIDAIVVALPRGGVPIGFSLAKTLGIPLDILLVRKLGVPDHEELAMGAIVSGGVRVLNADVLRDYGIPADVIDVVAQDELRTIERRERFYRLDHPALPLRGRVVILVDDGIATGATMRAAVQAVRRDKPARVIIAAPVAPPDSVDELRGEVDDLVCLAMPEPFYAVGLWYEDFSQTSDAEVRELLVRSREEQSGRKK